MSIKERTLTLTLRYRVISDSRKMYNLLTLVDRLDFICKRKSKSLLVTKKKKKKKLTVIESELFIPENRSQ